MKSDFQIDDIDVIALDVNEYLDISRYGENFLVGNERDLLHFSNQGRYFTLRRYFNNNWGSCYPVSDTEIKIRTKAYEYLDPGEAEKAIEEGVLSVEKALSLIKLDETGGFGSYASLDYGEGNSYIALAVEFEDAVGGAASGYLAFSATDIARLKQERPGEDIVLAMETAEPGIIHMLSDVSALVVLNNDEKAQHIKIIAENNDLPVLIGVVNECSANIEDGVLKTVNQYDREHIFRSGAGVSIEIMAYSDGSGNRTVCGKIIPGKYDVVVHEHVYRADDTLISSVDALIKSNNGIAIRANADTPKQIANAIKRGANGAGLIRTENMFHEPKHLEWLQKHILTSSFRFRENDLSSLVQMQTKDFAGILRAAKEAKYDFPLTIRLLDIVPEENLKPGDVARLIKMLGKNHVRGLQLARKRGVLYRGQLEGLFNAAAEVGYTLPLKIEIPTTRTEVEISDGRELVDRVGAGVPHKFGSMIENLDAVNNARVLAPYCDFAMFGTNDLTTDLLGGIRRNDIGASEAWANANNHTGKGPFLRLAKITEETIVRASNSMRSVVPEIELGICGKQVCNDRASIEFAIENGLDISVPSKYLPYVKLVTGQFYAKRALKL